MPNILRHGLHWSTFRYRRFTTGTADLRMGLLSGYMSGCGCSADSGITYLNSTAGCTCLSLRWGLIVTVAAEYVGAGFESANGETTVRAASSPMTIIWSLIALSAWKTFLRLAPYPETGTPLRWIRRVSAFVLDVVAFVTSVGGLLALIPLVVEAMRVGHFHWSFRGAFWSGRIGFQSPFPHSQFLSCLWSTSRGPSSMEHRRSEGTSCGLGS